MRAILLVVSSLLGLALAGTAQAATCRNPAGFQAFLDQIKKEAIAKGISPQAVDEALAGVQFDQGVIRRDHGQGVFRQSFEQFSQRMVNPRLARARALQRRYADIFQRIEAQYGVSSPVLLAIWGLETDFGAVHPNFRTVQSIATLAFDCRRTAMFQDELFYALRMVQEGVSPSMRGAWAGEIGQTQFMPSTYVKYAVGGKDLDHNVYDVLASTANFLRAHGWRHGAGWEPGQPNFAAIQEWNKAPVYSRTIAYFATRLAGGGDAGGGVAPRRRAPAPTDMEPDEGGTPPDDYR
jgi:membrane-bound lytic murein transglycosylase B